MLVSLTFICADVAPSGVLVIRTGHAALVGRQQMALTIGAASGVTPVNCRARQKRFLARE